MEIVLPFMKVSQTPCAFNKWLRMFSLSSNVVTFGSSVHLEDSQLYEKAGSDRPIVDEVRVKDVARILGCRR